MSISIILKYPLNGVSNIVYSELEVNQILNNLNINNQDYIIKNNILFWKASNNIILIGDINFNEINKIIQLFDLGYDLSTQSIKFNLKSDANGQIYDVNSVMSYIGYSGSILDLVYLYNSNLYDDKYINSNSNLVINEGLFGVQSASLKFLSAGDNIVLNSTSEIIEINLNNDVNIDDLTINNYIHQNVKGSYYEIEHDNSYNLNSLCCYNFSNNTNKSIINNQTNINLILGVYIGLNNNKAIIQNTGIVRVLCDNVNFTSQYDYNNGDYVMLASDPQKVQPHTGNSTNDVIGIILIKPTYSLNVITGLYELGNKLTIKLI